MDRERVGLAVLQLIEDGELTKLQKKWWYEKGECLAEADLKVLHIYYIQPKPGAKFTLYGTGAAENWCKIDITRYLND